MKFRDDVFETFAEKLVFRRPGRESIFSTAAGIDSIDFHRKEPFLISASTQGHGPGSASGQLRLYDYEKGVHERTCFSNKFGASSVRFTHHPLSILYASTVCESTSELENHAIRYHSLHDNAYLKYFKGHKDTVVDLEMSAVSDTFLSSSMDKTVKKWDLRQAECVGEISVRDTGTLRPRVACDSEDLIIAVGLDGGYVKLYDVRKLGEAGLKAFVTIGGEYTKLNRPTISCLKLSKRRGTKYVALAIEGKVHVHDIERDDLKDGISLPFEEALLHTFHTRPVFSDKTLPLEKQRAEFDFSACDRYLISGCGSNMGLRAWNLETGARVADLTSKPRFNDRREREPRSALSGFHRCVKFSPTHALLATGSTDVALWVPEQPKDYSEHSKD